MKKLILGVLISLLTILSIAYAAYNGATVSEGITGRYSDSTAGQDDAQGGNVTLINLSTTESTLKWQGYYGNISGVLRLGLGTSIFYDFGGGATSSATAVFASTNQSFDFASLAQVEPSSVDTAWGYNAAGDIDRAVDVFSTARSISGVVANTTTLLGAGTWYSAIFSDATPTHKSNFAFGANVTIAGSGGFNGNDYNYQLMVPVNDTTLDTYYFFLEV